VTRTALVTGITGFIGGKLAERLLADGWDVHAIVRSSSDRAALPAAVSLHVYDGTIGSLDAALAAGRPDVVFHLASLFLAAHQPDQVEALVQSNILFPAQLAEAMVAAGVTRFVNTGTAWQHFESTGYEPVNLYAATKQGFSDLLRFYQNARGLSVVTLKLFDTFGEGDKRRKLAQLLLDAAVSGERLQLSPGKQVLDLTHVDDVADAFVVAAERLLAAEARLDEEYLVSGERMDIRQMVEVVEQVSGRPLGVEFGARPYRDREVMMPPGPEVRAKPPGWTPMRPFRKWVAERLAHMEAAA
jgi:nucleoside-diphosphate-sugar epimerase